MRTATDQSALALGAEVSQVCQAYKDSCLPYNSCISKKKQWYVKMSSSEIKKRMPDPGKVDRHTDRQNSVEAFLCNLIQAAWLAPHSPAQRTQVCFNTKL